jgi:hypothetical protein
MEMIKPLHMFITDHGSKISGTVSKGCYIHRYIEHRIVVCVFMATLSLFAAAQQESPGPQAPGGGFVLEMAWMPGRCIPEQHIHAGPGNPDECYSTTISIRDFRTSNACTGNAAKLNKNIRDHWTITGLYGADDIEAEWRRSGACSGLSQSEYFCGIEKAFSQLVVPNELIQLRVPRNIGVTDLENLFEKASNAPHGAIKAGCSDNQLTTIWACYTRDFQFTPCGGDVHSQCSGGSAVVKPTEEIAQEANKQYKPPVGDCESSLLTGKSRDEQDESQTTQRAPASPFDFNSSDNVPSLKTINVIRIRYQQAVENIQSNFEARIKTLRLVNRVSPSPISMHFFQSGFYYNAAEIAVLISSTTQQLVTAMRNTRLYAMADYIESKMPTVSNSAARNGLITQSEGNKIIQQVKDVFASLKRVEPSLSVNLLLTSTPDRAEVAFATAVTSQFSHPVTNQTVTLYRGIYRYAIARDGFKGYADWLNLVDQPVTHIKCELKSTKEAEASFCRPLEK